MTDGIIQEIFKKYSVMNEPIVWLLDKVEQELIEKIQQFNFDWLPEGRITKIIPKDVLIGDRT